MITAASWMHLASGAQLPPHIVDIDKHLLNTPGDIIIQAPVRHGKSQMLNWYAAWYLCTHPKHKVMYAVYGDDLAKTFGRAVRAIINEYGQEWFGVTVDANSRAADTFALSNGSIAYFLGIDGAATGRGCNLLIIDDPYKSHTEAHSARTREHIWNQWNSSFRNRVEPGGRRIVMHARWHSDDLIGRLLEKERLHWTNLRYPALAEENDPLGRKPGQALWPRRYTESALALARDASPFHFAALYQQHPVPRDGGLFKSEWIKYGNPPSGGKFVRYWDRASTASADACNTAGVLIQRLGHEFYIRDIVVGRWDVKRRDQNILATAKMDVDLNPRIFVEQEPSSAGVESVQNAMNMLQGYPAYPDRVRGDKVVRADPLASAFGMGKVTICPAPWNDSFVTELLGFPNGRFCDQVDAAAGAFSKLTRDTDPQAAADILRSL